MENLIEKDILEMKKVIKNLECDELFFLQEEKDDFEGTIEIAIEIKGCLIGKDKDMILSFEN